MTTRSPQDYPWPVPLHDGLIGPNGFMADSPVSPGARETAQPRTPVLAVGSNASPEVLADKLATALADAPDEPVVVEICVAAGLAVGHSAHISRPGYVAATPFLMTPTGEHLRPGHETAYSLGWFTDDQLAALDATEPNYDRVLLPPRVCAVARSSGATVNGVMVYRSRHGVLGDDGRALSLRPQDGIHRWLAQRLPHLAGRSDPSSYADPPARERVRVELIQRGLVVPSGLS